MRQSTSLAIGSALFSAPWLCAGLLLGAPAADAAIVLNIRQVGQDVTIEGSGSANLSALSLAGSSTSFTNSLTGQEAYAGPAAFANGVVDLWQGLAGPLAFNPNPIVELPDAAGSSGDLFGIMADNGSGSARLVLPQGYLSGSSLSGSSLFPNTDLASIGLTPGTYSWLWGSGATADSLNVVIVDPVAVPAPLPLAGAAFAFSWASALRRRCRGTNTTSSSAANPAD